MRACTSLHARYLSMRLCCLVQELADSFWERAAAWLATPLSRLDAAEAAAAVAAAGELTETLCHGFEAAVAERAAPHVAAAAADPSLTADVAAGGAGGLTPRGTSAAGAVTPGVGGVSFAPQQVTPPPPPPPPSLADGAARVATEVRPLSLLKFTSPIGRHRQARQKEPSCSEQNDRQYHLPWKSHWYQRARQRRSRWCACPAAALCQQATQSV